MFLNTSHRWWNLRNDGVDEASTSLWSTDTPIPHPLGRPQRLNFLRSLTGARGLVLRLWPSEEMPLDTSVNEKYFSHAGLTPKPRRDPQSSPRRDLYVVGASPGLHGFRREPGGPRTACR